MQDNALDVRPRDFAESNLDAADRAPFADAMRTADIDPNVAFEKDTSLVKVKGFRMVFDSGMVLVGNSEDLERRVTIRSEDAVQTGVEVNDSIKRLTGR